MQNNCLVMTLTCLRVCRHAKDSEETNLYTSAAVTSVFIEATHVYFGRHWVLLCTETALNMPRIHFDETKTTFNIFRDTHKSTSLICLPRTIVEVPSKWMINSQHKYNTTANVKVLPPFDLVWGSMCSNKCTYTVQSVANGQPACTTPLQLDS